MTRKSKRELERAIDSLGGGSEPLPDDPVEAAQTLFWRLFRDGAVTSVMGFEYENGDVPEEQLCLGFGATFVWYASPEDVPAWLAEELPVVLPDPPVRFGEVRT